VSNSGTRALGHSTLQVLDPSGAQRHRGDHEQVGFTEAFGDGLLAQFMLLRWALTHKAGGRDALAVYLKSVSRGWDAEAQANAIRAKTNPSFEHAIKSVTADLHAHATPDLNLDGLHEVGFRLSRERHRLRSPSYRIPAGYVQGACVVAGQRTFPRKSRMFHASESEEPR